MYCIVTVVRFVIILIKFYVCMYVCMYVEKYRDLEIPVKGQSRSLKVPCTRWFPISVLGPYIILSLRLIEITTSNMM